jgi:ankyrin repeat protein
MTFDEVEKCINRDERIGLREALDNDLDPNLSNKFSWTILMLAAMRGNVAIGRMLIEHGAKLDTRNMHKDTALSLTIQFGHAPFVRLLLENGASRDCHPHGNSLDIFLEWAEEYCACSTANMKKIRALLYQGNSAQSETPADVNH